MFSYKRLVEQPAGSTEELTSFLESYFPEEVVKTQGKQLANHMLFHEIAATVQVNHIVGRAGIEFLPAMVSAQERDTSEITAAYLVAEELLQVEAIRNEIESLEGKVSTDILYPALISVDDELRRGVTALLTLRSDRASLSWSNDLSDAPALLEAFLSNPKAMMSADSWALVVERKTELMRQGLPEGTATKVALLPLATYIPSISWFAKAKKFDAKVAASHFFYAGMYSGITPLRTKISEQIYSEDWDQLAIHSIDRALLGSLAEIVSVSVPQHADPEKATAFSVESPLSKTADDIEAFSKGRIPVSACFVLNERLRDRVAGLKG